MAALDDPEACKRSVSEAIAKFGKLDVVVNSAGILVGGSIETLSLEDYDKQMNINTRSIFVVTQAAVPHLKKTQGNIVNVSSVTGTRSVRKQQAFRHTNLNRNKTTKYYLLNSTVSGSLILLYEQSCG